MNKKLLIGIISAAGILLVSTLIIVVIALRSQPESQTNNTNDTTNTENTTNTNSETNTTTSTDSQTDTGVNTNTDDTSNVVLSNQRTSISRAATSFTERYGSYSSDSNFDNIEVLDSVMTENMKKQAENVIKNGLGTKEYYSIATQAASVNFVDYVDGSTGATLEVFTRRTEQKGLNDPVIFSQTARLQLNRVDNQWKIDSFKWL